MMPQIKALLVRWFTDLIFVGEEDA